MMLVKADPDFEAGRPPDPALMAAIGKLSQAMAKSGVLVQSGGLLPSSKGARVRVGGGKMSVTDGPFAETKEVLGGYFLADCKDLDQAIELAQRVPLVEKGSVEIRPLVTQ